MEKLYHLINGEFVHDGMPEVQIPTYAEIGARIAILNDIGFFDDRIVAESVTFDGISNGKRNTEKQASLYDAMLAEIMDDRMAEKSRVRNRRKNDRKYKVLPKERKHREEMRKDRMFGYYFNENCPKVMFAPDSEPIKNRKYAEENRIIRADWEIESAEIELDAEIDFWMRKIERERLENLNEWLKYA